MDEEKIIKILRYHGVVRNRKVAKASDISLLFKTQWSTAKKWVRIMEALPEGKCDYNELMKISNAYRDIDKTRVPGGKEDIADVEVKNLYGIPALEVRSNIAKKKDRVRADYERRLMESLQATAWDLPAEEVEE